MASKVFLITGNAGQGKTTIAKNIAFALRNFGFDVLVVDADMRTPKLGHHVGMPLTNYSIQDVLIGRCSLKQAMYEKPSGLKLLLSSLTEVKTAHPSTLLPELRRLAEVVVIDAPNDDVWHSVNCDTLVVTQPDFPSVLEAQKIVKKANVKGVIVNRMHYDGVDLSVGNIQQLISAQIVGVIPEARQMREALRHGYSIVEFHPELEASIILKQVAAKLMNLKYTSPVRKTPLLAKLGLIQ